MLLLLVPESASLGETHRPTYRANTEVEFMPEERRVVPRVFVQRFSPMYEAFRTGLSRPSPELKQDLRRRTTLHTEIETAGWSNRQSFGLADLAKPTSLVDLLRVILSTTAYLRGPNFDSSSHDWSTAYRSCHGPPVSLPVGVPVSKDLHEKDRNGCLKRWDASS